MRNPELATGDVEVRATALKVVGPATPPAIPVARARNENLAAEEIRLRHRFLDLRRTELQDNIILRHRLMQVTRQYLSERSFIEIETPILTKPTPEGARDYLVPSRVHPGEFYALPQSPQLYKQLLMVSGFDRYFQIARCFRDEDLRQDRQPEFTQIDIEASFIAADDIMTISEGLITALWKEAGASVPDTIPRLTYAECMERFGCDRPDTRYGLEIFDATEVFRGADFGITRTAIEQGGRVRGIRVPGGGALSRKQQDEIEAEAKKAGALGLLRLKLTNGALEGPVAKFLAEGAAARLDLAGGRSRAVRRGTRSRFEPGIGSGATGRRAPDEHGCRHGVASSCGSRISRCSRRTRRPARSARYTTRSRRRCRRTLRCSTQRRNARARRRMTSCSTGRSSAAEAFVSAIRACSRACSACSASTRRRRRRASDFCSRGFAPARRRTAASRSDSIASR